MSLGQNKVWGEAWTDIAFQTDFANWLAVAITGFWVVANLAHDHFLPEFKSVVNLISGSFLA